MSLGDFEKYTIPPEEHPDGDAEGHSRPLKTSEHAKLDKALDYKLIQKILDDNFKKVLELFARNTEINDFERFMIRHFTGADLAILERCAAQEKNKYFVMALGVCSSTALAFIASFFFFYSFSVSNYGTVSLFSAAMILTVSSVISLIIMVIEYSIVSTRSKNISGIIFRLCLSVLMGYVFAQPLEVWIFQSAINEKMAVFDKQEKDSVTQNDKAAAATLQKTLAEQWKMVEKAESIERVKRNNKDGNCRDFGEGSPQCQMWQETYNAAVRHHRLALQRYQDLEKANNASIGEIEDTEKKIKDTRAKDVMKQMKMLHLVTDDWGSWLYRYGIMLLLMVLDAFPAIIKTTAKEAGYEMISEIREMLEAHQKEAITSHNKQFLNAKYAYDLVMLRFNSKMSVIKQIMQESNSAYLDLLEATDKMMGKIVALHSKIEPYKDKPEYKDKIFKYEKNIDKILEKFYLDMDKELKKVNEINESVKFPDEKA